MISPATMIPPSASVSSDIITAIDTPLSSMPNE